MIDVVGYVLVPSAPPKNIHFKMMGNTTVMLIWEPPPKNHRHGPLLGYRVLHCTARLIVTQQHEVFLGDPVYFDVLLKLVLQLNWFYFTKTQML